MSHPDPRHIPPPMDPDTRRRWASGEMVHGRPLGLSLMLLWALFVGWWAALVGTILAWGLVLSGGSQRGLQLLGRLPYWAFPRLPGLKFLSEVERAIESIQAHQDEQRHPALRVAYAVSVGWWLSALALLLAWIIMMTLYGIPTAHRLHARIPCLATLARY